MQLRKATAAACALFLLGALGLGGCSTDAVGIEACRTIQTARCEVAPTCLGQEDFSIETEDQVENCKTYYIDGCLVGVENPDAGDETGKDCEKAIRALGKCEADGTPLADCDGATLRDGEDEATSNCMALAAPNLLEECAWLEKVEDEDE
ncbi:MAG: hypothetical protein JNK04_19185 [Myxococcales bacterium]|nr:hypothetical protein [Myxococcales bacterium]